jgi:protein-arginine kinase activator protein McsA
MEKSAKELDFMQAAKLRDEIKALQDNWLNYTAPEKHSTKLLRQ